MAQWNKNNQDYLNQERSLFEVFMCADKYGNIGNCGGSSFGQLAAFGENLSVAPVPVVQLDAIYGINGGVNEEQYETYSALSGITTTVDNEYRVGCSTSLGSYGVLRSSRFLRYKPGQGAMGRFACRFSEGVENTEQRSGMFNQENALMVGYSGTSFGILHSYGGQAPIVSLAVTTAPTSTGISTIVLNDTNYHVSLTSGETTSQTAARITRVGIFTGWIPEQRDNEVYFLSESLAPKTGAFSFTHSTAKGSFTTKQTGITATDNWIPQSSWNVDTCDGSGNTATNPSGITLDPTKFNVYETKYRWLGAGVIQFALEHPDTGEIINIHNIHWTNRNTTLSLTNPSMKIGHVAYNLGGGVGTAVTVYGGSMGMFIEGEVQQIDYPKAAVKSSSSGLAQNVLHHILTIRNPITFFNKINTREVIIQDMTCSVQSTDPVEVYLMLDEPLATGNHVFVQKSGRYVLESTVTGTFNKSTISPIIAMTLAPNGSQQFDLTKYKIVLSANKRLSIALFSTNSISNHAVAFTWKID